MEGLESFSPDEGQAGGLEALSEEAKQRFAAAAKAMKKQKKDEKRAKKRDAQVARTIIQFLNDDQHARFFILISKLVARNCPSIFILGILSLINEGCLKAVEDYFADQQQPTAREAVDESMALIQGSTLDADTNRKLIDWITRLQMILSHDPERILDSLLIDHKSLDGSVLQLTIFVLQEFFQTHGLKLPYEKAQPLTVSILQTVFEPFMGLVQKKMLETTEDDEEDDD